jgi:acyl-CoA thioesterase FadM
MNPSADSVFQRTFEAPFSFEEISERGSLKLTSILRTTAPRHFELWLDKIGGPTFFESTGLFLPIVAFDLFVTDQPIQYREPLEIDVTIRLGRQVDASGDVRRIVSESISEVYSKHAETGDRVLVARNLKHNAITRNDPDPAKRRVVELPDSMLVSGMPERIVALASVTDLATPPAGYAESSFFEDTEPHYWSYQQTDMNQHIHAMEYVRMMELFATDHLARAGWSSRDCLIERARVAFRKPCFTGESYRRNQRLYRNPGASPAVLCGGLYKGDSDDDRPAVATQLFVRHRQP